MRAAIDAATVDAVLDDTRTAFRKAGHAAVLTILVPVDPTTRPTVVGRARASELLAASDALLYGATLSPDLLSLEPSDGKSDPVDWVRYARRALTRIVGKLA